MKRGVAAVAVSGGALSLMSAAAPSDIELSIPAQLTASVKPDPQAVLWLPASGPSTDIDMPAEPLIDTSTLVRDVQLAQADATRLVAAAKAVADKAAADKAAAAKALTGGCNGLPTAGLGAVLPHVRQAAQFIGCRFGKPTMYGVSGRAGTSDHPSGKAVDFMVDTATGNALADCALHNMKALGITYVIWRQRINFGQGWQAMEDRGSITENHYDHVHVSFGDAAGGPPAAC